MAQHYGDIPCVNLNGEIHITTSATQCLCGRTWKYGERSPDRPSKRSNIIWRSIDAVTCQECKRLDGHN